MFDLLILLSLIILLFFRLLSILVFFDDLGSLDLSFYIIIVEVGLIEMGVGVLKECFLDFDLLLIIVFV